VVASDEWKETLRQRGWLDLYQPSGDFAAYLKSEQTRVKATLEDIGLVK
jgi:putative tricarboxylic transport membrane protein